MKLNYKLAIFLTSLCLSASCKKDSSSSDEPSDTSTSEDEVDPEEEETSILEPSDNVLALSYPEGLSIGAFPVEVTQLDAETSGTLSVDLNLMSEPPPSPQSPTSPDSSPTNEFNPHKKPIDKLADRKKIINGEIDTCFSEDIVRALTYSSKQSEICYGYDYGLVSGLALGKADLGQTYHHMSQITSADQSLTAVLDHIKSTPGLSAPTKPIPCVVATGQDIAARASARVEGAIGVIEGMLCQAKKDGTIDDLPIIGESVDLLSVFSKQTHFTASSASITRDEDVDGRARYHTAVAIQVPGGPAKGLISLDLVHSPSVDGNKTYDGVMWIKEDGVLSNQNPSWNFLSIAYNKSGTDPETSRTKLEIRKANYAQSIYEPLISPDGKLDLNPGADANGSLGPGSANDYMNAIEYWNFDISPFTFEGKMEHWINPGGSTAEKPRGIVFETIRAEDGTLSGCAHAGSFQMSIRQALRDNLKLAPDGCYTPFLSNGICGDPGDNQGPQIWKQCYVQAADGSFGIDTTKTTGVGGGDGFDVLTGPPADLPKFTPPAEK